MKLIKKHAHVRLGYNGFFMCPLAARLLLGDGPGQLQVQTWPHHTLRFTIQMYNSAARILMVNYCTCPPCNFRGQAYNWLVAKKRPWTHSSFRACTWTGYQTAEHRTAWSRSGWGWVTFDLMSKWWWGVFDPFRTWWCHNACIDTLDHQYVSIFFRPQRWHFFIMKVSWTQ